MQQSTGRRARRRAPLLAAAVLAAGAAYASETISYDYDAQGRLAKVSRTGSVNNHAATVHQYDKADNRTLRTVSGAVAVPDHSFERHEIGSGYKYPPVEGSAATFTHPAGIAGNGSAFGFAPAPDGDQVAFVQSFPSAAGAVSLRVTGLTANTSYRVRFRLARRPGYGVTPVSVAADGAVLGVFTPESNAFQSFETTSFTATGTSATISFTGTPMPVDSASGLDFVTVSPP